jgi:DNA invertase Pin-like site-specific DNA recombinase
VLIERQDAGSDAQRHALEMAGCGEIIEEKASGGNARPMLAELVDRLAPR